MSDDRKVIKVHADVFERHKQHKGRYETWNHYMSELAELAEEDHDPGTLDDDSDGGPVAPGVDE